MKCDFSFDFVQPFKNVDNILSSSTKPGGGLVSLWAVVCPTCDLKATSTP